MVEFEGTVERIVYRNDDNGYTVAKLENGSETATVTGYLPFITEGHKVKVTGDWMKHPTFGSQIKVESCEEVAPSTIEGVEKFLASGLVRGIGPVTAKKIVEKFGMDAIDIIEMNPGRLTEIEGIGEKKALSIGDSFSTQRELRNVMVFLQSYGISTSYGIKIFKKYGSDTIAVVRDNPYRLCEDITGIGFKTADKIARNLGADMASPYRVKAGIKYVLSGCVHGGHVYLPETKLFDECSELLSVDREILGNSLVSLAAEKQIIIEDMGDERAIYTSVLYYAELGVAKKLIELSISGASKTYDNIEEEITRFEDDNDITFSEEQKKAIEGSINNSPCIITGGPGTGKTTIIKCIISIFQNKGMNISLAAPTGRAAKRMTEATGCEAKTMHRLLEMEYSGDESVPEFSRDEGEPIESDVIIIDEASMVDILLMNSMLKAVSEGTRLILVGDVDQLPSVGPGNVLRDIIDSGSIEVAKLQRIYRQGEESLITINAHRINRGEFPELNDREKDFFFIQKGSAADIVEEVVRLVDTRLPSFKEGFDPMRDIQVLSPMRKGESGINNLNKELQKVLNPVSKMKEEKEYRDFVFRKGDKVMQVKNNYSVTWKIYSGEEEVHGTGIFNGDIGYIQDIDNENQIMKILFDDEKLVEYEFSSLDELEMAYAVTIHKSQGSEFPVVVIPVWFGPPMLMTRNLIYTAVTRAKKLVVLVGSGPSLKAMINNNNISRRYTRLKERIEKMLKLL